MQGPRTTRPRAEPGQGLAEQNKVHLFSGLRIRNISGSELSSDISSAFGPNPSAVLDFEFYSNSRAGHCPYLGPLR
ncbi:hypothetical protein EVAR_92416_1 [Eumeta japonica]|uniref:Uncharacterized protein n=1 Tax=Eumeta variegata TaxID=151549 RepID=A0A4C1T8I9_EUMVA|nr:hypothetical protein EVAR_92416_1 [Eumeta japonica]